MSGEAGVSIDNIDYVALVRVKKDADDLMVFRFHTVDGRDFHFGASVGDTLGIVGHFADVVMKTVSREEAAAALADDEPRGSMN